MVKISWNGDLLGSFSSHIIKEQNSKKHHFILSFPKEEENTSPIEFFCFYRKVKDFSLKNVYELARIFKLQVQPHHLIIIENKNYFLWPQVPSTNKKISWKNFPPNLINETKANILFAKLGNFNLSAKTLYLENDCVYFDLRQYHYPKKMKNSVYLYELIVTEEKEIIHELLSRFFQCKISWSEIMEKRDKKFYKLKEKCEKIQHKNYGEIGYFFVQDFYQNFYNTTSNYLY